MRMEEVKPYIEEHLSVTRQQVTLAKAFILDYCRPHWRCTTKDILKALLEKHEVSSSGPEHGLLLDDPVACKRGLRQTLDWISWCLAAEEAVWGLIGASRIVPLGLDKTYSVNFSFNYKDGGTSGGLPLNEIGAYLPAEIRLAPSMRNGVEQPLTDGDLYLQEIDIDDLHEEVKQALREAAECFRHDLYAPCLAML